MTDPQPGEIWWIDLEPVVGSEANKARPCVVVGAAEFAAGPLRLIVPATAWQPRFANHRNKVPVEATSENGLDYPSTFDVLQIRSASLHRFRHRSGTLRPEDLVKVMEALALVTGLHYEGEPDLA